MESPQGRAGFAEPVLVLSRPLPSPSWVCTPPCGRCPAGFQLPGVPSEKLGLDSQAALVLCLPDLAGAPWNRGACAVGGASWPGPWLGDFRDVSAGGVLSCCFLWGGWAAGRSEQAVTCVKNQHRLPSRVWESLGPGSVGEGGPQAQSRLSSPPCYLRSWRWHPGPASVVRVLSVVASLLTGLCLYS